MSARSTPVPSVIPPSTTQPAIDAPAIEVRAPDPDPPSLAAATMDVVPSSVKRELPIVVPPPKRGAAIAIALLGAIVAVGIALLFLLRR